MQNVSAMLALEIYSMFVLFVYLPECCRLLKKHSLRKGDRGINHLQYLLQSQMLNPTRLSELKSTLLLYGELQLLHFIFWYSMIMLQNDRRKKNYYVEISGMVTVNSSPLPLKRKQNTWA